MGRKSECDSLSNGGLNCNPYPTDVHFGLLNGKTARERNKITPMCWEREINTAAGCCAKKLFDIFRIVIFPPN